VLPNKINYFTAWVDVADHGKGSAKGSRHIIIKKLERKASVKGQPAFTVSEDWHVLYNQSLSHKK
jgi:hypothetical protein